MGKPTVWVEKFLHKRLLFREFEWKTGITVKNIVRHAGGVCQGVRGAAL